MFPRSINRLLLLIFMDTMYKKGIYTIVENRPLTESVWLMRLAGDTQWLTRAGQFVMIELEGHFLRRPISVCDYDAEGFTIIYKVVGEGTADMSRMEAGVKLDIITGLGNGFSIEEQIEKPLLVGGGVGVPPMYGLARKFIERGLRPTVVLGFNTAKEIFFDEEFRRLGCDVHVTTVDGSAGVKGFVTTPLAELEFDYLYACGPLPMLKALCDNTSSPAQLSLEERMGCGFGACMGCSCKTHEGNKRICKEGPVLRKEEIIW